MLAGGLNCSIVGLASSGEEPSALSHVEPDNRTGFPECLGLGFVRGVNAEQGLMYLLTDLEPDILEQVNVLQVISL